MSSLIDVYFGFDSNTCRQTYKQSTYLLAFMWLYAKRNPIDGDFLAVS